MSGQKNKPEFKITQQRFAKGVVLSVTGKDKLGIEHAFMIVKPEEFVKLTTSPVKVHIAPKDYVEQLQSICTSR